MVASSFWIFIFFLLNFNSLLKFFLARSHYTLVYIVILFLFYMYRSAKTVSKFKVKLKIVDCFIILYAFWIFLCFFFQIVFNNTTDATFISFGQTIIPLFGYAIAKRIDDKTANNLEQIYIFFSVISILLGYFSTKVSFLNSLVNRVEYVRVDGLLETRAFSMAGGSLSTGYICGIAIGFLLVSQINKKIKLFLLVFIFMYSIMTYSRGGVFFAIIISITNYLWWYFVENKGSVKVQTVIKIIIILLAMCIFVLLNWEVISTSIFYQRMVKQGFSVLEDSNVKRKLYQEAGLDIFLRNFLFGKGFGFVGYEAVVYKIMGAFSPENYFLLLGINTGGIGVCLFAFVVIYAILGRNYYNERENRKYISIIVGIIAWGVMYIVIESDLNALIFWYCVGRLSYCEIKNELIKPENT